MNDAIKRRIGVPYALASGVLVSIGERIIFSLALRRPLEVSGEADSIVMNAVLVSMPFLVLAFRSHSRLASWLMAFALTVLVHGWWLSKGIAYQRAPDGSGVDMLGALLLLVSPLPIALLAVALDSAFQRHAKVG